MKDEYVIISKTAILKKIEELEKIEGFIKDFYNKAQLDCLKQVLSQSISLIPEIKKAYDAGVEYGIDTAVAQDKGEDTYLPDYISNLKLDI